MKAVGIFLLFGAITASLAGTTLLWRGTPLDRMWILNVPAHNQLTPLGRAIGIPFLLLGVALFTAGVGWIKHRRWGWNLAVAIIAIQWSKLCQVVAQHLKGQGLMCQLGGRPKAGDQWLWAGCGTRENNALIGH